MEIQNLFEFGDLIRRKREKLGLERDEIALRIKISTRMLQAIEDGAAEHLPQPAFARGFVRTYAKALDMDIVEVDAMLELVFPSGALNNVHADMTYSGAEQRPGSGGRRRLILCLVLLVLAFLLGLWLFLGKQDEHLGASDAGASAATVQSDSQPSPSTIGGSASLPRAGLQSANSVGEPASRQTGAGQAGAAVSVAEESGRGTAALAGSAIDGGQPSANAPVEAERSEQPAPRQALGEAVPESNSTISAAQAVGTHRIIIYAEKNCWIGASFDGVENRNFTLQANKHLVLDFKRKLSVNLGNAAGVKVLYDGKPYSVTAKRSGTAEFNLP